MINKVLGYFGYHKNAEIQEKIKEVVNVSTNQQDQINALLDGYEYLERRDQHHMAIILGLMQTLTDDNSVFISSELLDDIHSFGLDVTFDYVDGGIEVVIVDEDGNSIDPEFEDDCDDCDCEPD